MSKRKSSLGRVLKSISDKDAPRKKVSVVDAIDETCIKEAHTTDYFSVLKLKRTMKATLETLETDEFDRDVFFKSFQTLYDVAMGPDRRAVGVFHPSQLLDGCPRMMTYELSGHPFSDSRGKIGPALKRIFDVGTWYHVYFQTMLYRMGWLEQSEVPVVNEEKFISGKADGVFVFEKFGEKVVLEIKSMNTFIFQKAIFKPFKKHEFQASLYARELGATKVLYLYINKDTSEIKEFLEPLNEEQLTIADKKMNLVISHVKEESLPKRKCTDIYCDKAIDCPYRSLCFKD